MKNLIIVGISILLPFQMIGQFITTWQTTVNNESIAILTLGGGYNYDVDWGDGDITTGHLGNATHSYSLPGAYSVAITGVFPQIHINWSGGIQMISIDHWGSNVWRSMRSAFAGCSNLDVDADDDPNLSQVTDMSWMFAAVGSFSQNMDNWDVGNVNTMSYMFGNASTFNQDIGSWNVQNVTNLDGMQGMFLGAALFNQDISSWDVQNVKSMFGMFQGASSFNQNIASWNVGSVTNMANMFTHAISFNQNIGIWDVTNVTSMSEMFSMFNVNGTFNQDLGGWDVENVVDMNNMFLNTTLSSANYDGLLIGWSQQNVTSGLAFNGGNSYYCNAITERAVLENTYGWTITDGGENPVGPCVASSLVVSGQPISNGTYTASQLITATGSIPSAGNVFFNSGGSVVLNPIFEVALGGTFVVQ